MSLNLIFFVKFSSRKGTLNVGKQTNNIVALSFNLKQH